MTSELEPLKVTFFPPLYLQRRIWVLNILRREDITSVVDIGCGEGELLACLAQPAPWLRPPPLSIRPTKFTLSSCDRDPEANQDEIPNLHCTKIQGLDISSSDLQYAVLSTAPPLSNSQYIRWEPLEAKIWYGGLEFVNPEFVDVECIVSTEVIEHLPPSLLPIYAPMLLGVYHPRRLLLTTPSYTFNARFTPPDVIERSGYPDPTGRTNRIFRHHDHKFEWTVDEFKAWCQAAAEEWGYNVVVETIGRALEKDPWDREEECGGASQVAEFTRKEGEEFAEMRSAKSSAVELKTGEIELLVTHQHTPHTSSQRPVRSLREISEAVKLKMEQLEESLVRFEELWFEQDIAILCGGWIELLTDAVEEDERLFLKKENLTKKQWTVELIGGMQKTKGLWTDTEADRPLVNGSSEEDIDDSVEDEGDKVWGVGDSSWGVPRSWHDSDKQGEVEDDWGESWGSANESWGTM